MKLSVACTAHERIQKRRYVCVCACVCVCVCVCVVCVCVLCVCVCVCVCVCGCVCVCVCLCVISFLPPRASRPQNLGSYIRIHHVN